MTDEMPLYEGTKQLRARPMNKLGYCNYRGWTVPEDEDPYENGYLVEYEDGGKPNHPDHKGYISWSPADVFERTYVAMDDGRAPHIQRMAAELNQLAERTAKLEAFIDSNPIYVRLPEVKRELMRVQLSAMMTYRDTLAFRLKVEEDEEGAAHEPIIGMGEPPVQPVGFDRPAHAPVVGDERN